VAAEPAKLREEEIAQEMERKKAAFHRQLARDPSVQERIELARQRVKKGQTKPGKTAEELLKP
jgi:hypothetical protein